MNKVKNNNSEIEASAREDSVNGEVKSKLVNGSYIVYNYSIIPHIVEPLSSGHSCPFISWILLCIPCETSARGESQIHSTEQSDISDLMHTDMTEEQVPEHFVVVFWIINGVVFCCISGKTKQRMIWNRWKYIVINKEQLKIAWSYHIDVKENGSRHYIKHKQ